MDENKVKKIVEDLLAKNRYRTSDVAAHTHNGADSMRVSFQNLEGRSMTITHSLFGANAATAANYGIFFIAPFNCYVSSFNIVYTTKGSVDGTLQLEKLTGTTAPDSGTALLSSALSLTGTANTVLSGTLVGTTDANGVKNITLNAGDRLCLKDIDTLTDLAGLSITTIISF